MIIGFKEFNYNEVFKGFVSLKNDSKNGYYTDIYIESNCVEMVSPIALFVTCNNSMSKLGIYTEEHFVSTSKKSKKANFKVSHLERYYEGIESVSLDKFGIVIMPQYKSFRENMINNLAIVSLLNPNKEYSISIIETFDKINVPMKVLLNGGKYDYVQSDNKFNSNLKYKTDNASKFCAFTKDEPDESSPDCIDENKSNPKIEKEIDTEHYIFPELIKSSNGEYKDMLKKIDSLSDKSKSSLIQTNNGSIYIYTMRCNDIKDVNIIENKVNSVIKVFLQLFRKTIEEHKHIMIGFTKNKDSLNKKTILIGIPSRENALDLNTIDGFKYRRLGQDLNCGYWVYEYKFI